MINNKYASQTGTVLEVFLAFLKLGLTSFGGPIAHLGYFKKELVDKRRWVNDDQFGQLLVICQFLPGPASSQLGFCFGMLRAGWFGAFAAFAAFTLPSVILLIVFASALPLMSGPLGLAAIKGLKLVACAVVADAVLGMSRKLCPDAPTRTIAIVTAATLLFFESAWAQIMLVVVAAIAGIYLGKFNNTKNIITIQVPYGRRIGGLLLLLFAGLLVGLPIFATSNASLIAVADAFYRAGALVFGGGHVVLPLLEHAVVDSGWISTEQFLAGYGASQAIPGPMFAFSAYLGSVISVANDPYLTATVALFFMFLSGLLLVAGILPFWGSVSANPSVTKAITGVNAAVVGLLAAALYDPIFTSAVTGTQDLTIAFIAFALLAVWRASPLVVVTWCVFASVLLVWI